MSEADRALLTVLLDEVRHSYARCAAERRVLHEQEWASGGDAPSVLGEAEVRADAMIGLVSAWLGRRGKPEYRDELVTLSIHRSPALHAWFLRDGAAFPAFAAYLQAIEHLRAVALRVCG